MDTGLQSAPKLGRPRDEAARVAILKAANAILEKEGIAGFTIEAVAARAGVSKTTIYRWWPSRGALAVAGFLAEMEPKIAYPNTGSSLMDLVAQLKRVAAVYGSARPRREEAKAILRAGIERGELSRDIDIDVALDALNGPIYYRMLVPLGPLDSTWVETLARSVLAGLAATK